MLGRLMAEWNSGPVGCLFLLPLWNPVLVAEQVGTLAALTQSTFVLQTGVGDGKDTFEAMGASFKTRGTSLEESITEIKDIFERRGVTGNPDLQVNPIPNQKVEWWIGASTSIKGIQRAAIMGDAWYAAPFLNPLMAQDLLAYYLQACEEYGKEPRPVIRKDVIILEDGEKASDMGNQIIQRGYRGMKSDAVIVGNPIQAVEHLRPFKDMGFTDVTCRCMSIPHEEMLESISLLAEVREVLNN
jgi:alkanesulfonate monooxygenase SsuD/methylene tetrahydromethanopterin reductase-like flavin-dependent oxidoreductase (luciferase family)